MNIIVRPYGSQACYCRPDTTWERENKDFYVPEGIDKLLWAPIAFVRISKAGKCIGKKFTSRYYDAFNFGVLLYCCHDQESLHLAFSSCADHTSILPFPLYNIAVMENVDNTFEVRKGETGIFSHTTEGLKEKLEEAICLASKTTSLRIGDFVAVELAEIADLATRSEGETGLEAKFCGNEVLSLKMFF